MKRETEESEEGESDEEKSIKHLQGILIITICLEFKQKLGMADKEVELNFDLFYTVSGLWLNFRKLFQVFMQLSVRVIQLRMYLFSTSFLH